MSCLRLLSRPARFTGFRVLPVSLVSCLSDTTCCHRGSCSKPSRLVATLMWAAATTCVKAVKCQATWAADTTSLLVGRGSVWPLGRAEDTICQLAIGSDAIGPLTRLVYSLSENGWDVVWLCSDVKKHTTYTFDRRQSEF